MHWNHYYDLPTALAEEISIPQIRQDFGTFITYIEKKEASAKPGCALQFYTALIAPIAHTARVPSVQNYGLL